LVESGVWRMAAFERKPASHYRTLEALVRISLYLLFDNEISGQHPRKFPSSRGDFGELAHGAFDR
jgi:hypothetical protein